MMKYLVIYLSLCLVPLASIQADVPVTDRFHHINTTGWSWKIDSDATHLLKLYDADKAQPRAQYDLEHCMFCDGPEDDCERDGIFDITLKSASGEPVVVAVCHIGTHSRELQVFAPLRDRTNAILTVTGDYVIEYSVDDKGISVKYDRRNEDGKFIQHTTRWLATSKR